METIKSLIEKIKDQNLKYGDEIQLPAVSFDLEKLKSLFIQLFKFEIPTTFVKILEITNGIDNNGTVLYATMRALINGYEDRYIDGIFEANEEWHTNAYFAEYIFYADSEQYLFVQNIQSKLFSFHPRDNFETNLFSTTNEELFFQIILECALGEDIENKYA
ncbi:YrhA family protein [Sphingobacterium sp. SRCM116780]|uniref:YrhA family protein n=1 Tax=Sphingobacterium sp. SRCM116780 TaxID=2907623 RepID=UPI001F2083A5|nr:YrhA family protein [Sphingobacterium sp. SRCM116780]UIR57811.1 YrhA family protein [Sphingobacterium sp. SRCM116780]